MLRWLLVSVVLASRPAAADPACAALSPNTKITLSLKPDITVAELATWIMGSTCKNVVIDSTIAKNSIKATLLSPNTYTVKQALALVIDAIESTGLVVTQKPDTIVIKLGAKMPRSCPDIAATQPPLPAPPPETPDPDDAIAVAVASGIKQIDPTHYEIASSLVDLLNAKPMIVTKGARVVPSVKDGKSVGIKLYAIRPSSIYAKLGIANGDTITAVNGHALTSADALLELHTKLRGSKKLEVELTRRDKPLTLHYSIAK